MFFAAGNSKYLTPEFNSNFLTPSPSDILMESPSPINNCMMICNNTLFSSRSYEHRLSIDTVDSITKTNILNTGRHPGQAVKIVTESTGAHKIIKGNEVCKDEKNPPLKASKSCANIEQLDQKDSNIKNSKSNANLKEYKSCDENLVKFIFTKHGIQVISDVETIV